MFQVLEERTCPSTSVVMARGVLQITGDKTANRVAISDHGHGSIDVSVDSAGSKNYVGVTSVLVQVGAGDDVVDWSLAPKITGGDPGNPTGVSVDLGEGNDTFHFNATSPAALAQTGLKKALPIVVLGGNGDDLIKCQISSGLADTAFRIGLGTGNDIFDLGLFGSNPHAPSVLPPPLISWNVTGDGGDDQFNSSSSGITDGMAVDFFDGLSVNIDGGLGNDSFTTNLRDISLILPNAYSYKGAAGADTFNTNLSNVTIAAPFSLTEDGGGDNDTFVNDYNAITMPGDKLPPGWAALRILAGNGNDRVSSHMGSLVGAFDETVELGNGDGSYQVRIDPTAESPANLPTPAAYNVVVHGGTGADSFEAYLGRDDAHKNSRFTDLTLKVQLNFIDIAGANTFHVTMQNVNIDEPVQIRLQGGKDVDRMQTHFIGVGLCAPSDASVDGGAGMDVISLVAQQLNVPDGAPEFSSKIYLGGGRGADNMDVTFIDSAFPDHNNFVLSVHGDDDNDSIHGLIGMLRTGDDASLQAIFDGGKGNDVIAAVLLNDTRSRAHFAIQILGGAGNDWLEGALYWGFQDDAKLDLLIDGGTGFDTAFAYPGFFQLVNCERIPATF